MRCLRRKVVARRLCALLCVVSVSVGFAADSTTARHEKKPPLAPAVREAEAKNTAPGSAAHFADPDRLLSNDPSFAKTIEDKLAHFERNTGVRIVVRLFAKSPSAAEDAKAGAYMHALGEKLGTTRRGALAAYFADEDDWRVWIGDESTAAFFGRPVQAAELAEGAAFHAAKEAFLQQARSKADATSTAPQTSADGAKSVPANQKLRLQTEAVIDGLIDRLGAK